MQEKFFDLEADIYSHEDILSKTYVTLSEDECMLWKEAKKREKGYIKFSPLEGVTNYLMAREINREYG